MHVPLLVLRSEGGRQGGQRTVAAPAAGTAVAHCRRTAHRRQAIYRTRRVPADVTPRMRRNVMTRERRLCLGAVAGGLAFLLSAGAVLAQRPLAPAPKPDIPPPVPSILQNYKPVTAERLKQPEDGDWLMYRRTYDSWGYSPLAQITPE